MRAEKIYELKPRRPSPPTLTYPVDTWVNTREFVFEWRPSLRADTYILVIGTDQENIMETSVLQVETSETLQKVRVPEDESNEANIFYWQVWAENILGVTESRTSFFGIDTKSPTVTFERVAFLGQNKIILQWNGIDDLSGIESFDLQYRTDSQSWTSLLSGTTETEYIFDAITLNTEYCFRIRAFDKANNYSEYEEQCLFVPLNP